MVPSMQMALIDKCQLSHPGLPILMVLEHPITISATYLHTRMLSQNVQFSLIIPQYQFNKYQSFETVLTKFIPKTRIRVYMLT